MHITRRQFLHTTAAATAALCFARPARAASYGPFRMGAQSYSFRNFPFEQAMQELKKIGLTNVELFSAHFPMDPAHADLEKNKKILADNGITPVAYGVEAFTADDAANRKKFEFAKALGIEIITADPKPDSFDSLDKLTQEFGIAIAIHNHGPGASYDKAAETLKAVEGRNPLIGACVDTGHTIRSGEKPHEAIALLGSRVLSLHLKDWVHGGEEKILGEGDMDLTAVAKALLALNFKGPVMLEYENTPDNPGPDMQKGLANWASAIKRADR
jgi:inosose dehydratase